MPSGRARPLAQHRMAIAGAFLVQGLLFISLTTRLPRLQERFHLGELAISGLLLAVVLCAGVGSAVCEAVSHRRPSSHLLRLGLLTIGVTVAVAALAPGIPVLVVALAAYGLGLGVVDAASNMQAVALEHRMGRSILPSFYGAWTAGGLVGAAWALASTHLPLAAAMLPLPVPAVLAAAAPLLPRDGDDAAFLRAVEEVAVPWRPLLGLGAAMVLFYMVDTAASTWGPVFLGSVLDAPARVLPLATFPYLLATLVARLAGDRLADRFGAAPQLRVGAVVAALSLAAIAFAPSWPVAVAGFTVLGAAVAVIAPLSFSAAARIAGEGDPETRQVRVDAVIGRFNQFNYAGALIGAVLTGVVGHSDLRIGFAVPMVLILSILPLAGAFSPRQSRT